ncbi:MAG: hypothetical protein CMB80_03550 [Flammeovirgaceae bacterium]|nr:hypothetical protein [Flammeovirgaceae bacterium]|tara:strand:+ start:11829 stop:13748 length:1920 start_codon:yes stop_codon:yes gene_type:complete
MESFGPTYTADCQVIVKAFEKAAIYSTDPRSVYSMTTPIISKIRSDARNAQDQFQGQFDFSDSLEREKIPQNEGMNKITNSYDNSNAFDLATLNSEERDYFQNLANSASNNISNNPTDKSQDTEGTNRIADFLYGKEGQEGNSTQDWMSDCIPCENRIRAAGEFVKEFFTGDGTNAVDQWLELQKQHLFGAVQKLKSILDMFRKQGSDALHSICAFFDQFNTFRCPSDILVMIKALSGLLFKISIDLLGDFNFIADLVAALITPILSTVVQLLKNLILAIVDPIWCIIDSLQQHMMVAVQAGSELTEFAEDVTGRAGLGIGMSAADRLPRDPSNVNKDWSTMDKVEAALSNATPEYEEATIMRKKHPWAPDMSMEVPKVKSRTDDRISLFEHKAKSENDWTYAYFLELDQKKAVMDELIQQGSLTEDDAEYKAVKKEWNDADLRRHMKKTQDIIDASEELQQKADSFIRVTIENLMEFCLWIENLFRDTILEFGKLVGDSFTMEMGFLNKSGQKLTAIQSILLLSTLLKWDGKCDNEEKLQELLTEVYGYGSKTVIKSEDGKIKIVDEETGQFAGPIAKWTALDIGETGDMKMDTALSSLQEKFTSPTEMVFSCNKSTSSDVSTAQVNQWIQELQNTTT